ncbi:CDP-alcohol phosphatidyltransferase family protein [Pseudahrensia aquimaris]|uniref:CDP-alcohol phosphatidyltransferase family protein n=1 Tax=Pseudahrensia aquimaris TaxID=744461 RepID=A0ABW3FLM0_9HYPH
MFDNSIRPKIDPILIRLARHIADAGISANGVTLIGFALGCVAGVLIVFEAYWSALAFLLVSRLCDGLDGAVARLTHKSDFGGYLDIVLDFAFYGLIPTAFIIANPAANAVAGGVLLLTFYVNGASFLAYSVMAEKRGVDESDRGSKSLLYTIGLAEATETIIVFVLFCLLPAWFSLIAWVFAAVVAWTTLSRFMLARQTFGRD